LPDLRRQPGCVAGRGRRPHAGRAMGAQGESRSKAPERVSLHCAVLGVVHGSRGHDGIPENAANAPVTVAPPPADASCGQTPC